MNIFNDTIRNNLHETKSCQLLLDTAIMNFPLTLYKHINHFGKPYESID